MGYPPHAALTALKFLPLVHEFHKVTAQLFFKQIERNEYVRTDGFLTNQHKADKNNDDLPKILVKHVQSRNTASSHAEFQFGPIEFFNVLTAVCFLLLLFGTCFFRENPRLCQPVQHQLGAKAG